MLFEDLASSPILRILSDQRLVWHPRQWSVNTADPRGNMESKCLRFDNPWSPNPIGTSLRRKAISVRLN